MRFRSSRWRPAWRSRAAIDAATGLPVELKWPNDLVIGRPWRKLGGVLCESVGVGGAVDAVVVGIGLNLRPAAYPPELADRATSLEAELGRAVDRAPVVVEVLAALARRDRPPVAAASSRGSATSGAGSAGRAWRRAGSLARAGTRAPRCGARHRRDGALVVDAAGQRQRLVAGEVMWERLGRE